MKMKITNISGKFKQEFDQLCCILKTILTKKTSFPIDVCIRLFHFPRQEFERYYIQDFSSHLKKEEILNKYKAPILNGKQKQHCVALQQPMISFCEESEIVTLRVINAQSIVD